MTPDNKEKAEETTDLIAQTTKVLGIFGGGAVLFYAIGFTVVKTYIAEIELDGMFWFTREFYVDAGASFLLEIIQAPYLIPHIFLPYVLVLYLLVPKKSLKPKSVKDAVLGKKQIVKLSVLSAAFIGTWLFIYVYQSIISGTPAIAPIEYFIGLGPTISNKIIQGEAQPVFFTFTTPLAIVLGVFLYRFRGLLKGAQVDRMIHQGAIVVYVVYLTYIPIFYGRYIYDWQLVELKDPQIVERILSEGEEAATIDFGIPLLNNVFKSAFSQLRTKHIWLLGEFGDNYYFLTKEGRDGDGVIEIIDSRKLDRFNLDPYKKRSLRKEIRGRSASVGLTAIPPSDGLLDLFNKEAEQKGGKDK